jgi:hypothetical protein
MRVLMVIQRGTLLRFALLVPALAERGHDLHIALAGGEPPLQTIELAEKIRERHPNVTYGPFPKRTASAWGEVAWMVRGLADLAHNAHPRYAPARGLRQRTKKHVLRRLERDGSLEPLARRLAAREGRALAKKTDLERSRRALQLSAQLEGAIPTDPAIDRFVRELAPDAVVATGTFRHVSEEVEALKSARRLGIPTGIFISSWDSLTNKGALKFTPERVFVWNEAQARDAEELHLIPKERIRLTGAHPFDDWFARRPTRTREQLLTEIGLDPAQPYLAYLCSSGTIVGAPGVRRTTSTASGEAQFICNWVGALRASGDERLRRIGMIVRPHPNSKLDADAIRFENVVVWPPGGAYPVAANARADFFDTLTHTEAVVGINTTSMIEAAIVGKSVLTVLVPEFAQETTLHFHNLLAENGGFLHVASSLDEHVPQLANVLDEDEKGQERRRRFVEWFVRPGGIDRPAAPIAAEAIEELAGLPVDRDNAARARLLRLGLSLEVGLAAAHRSYRRVRPRGD